MNWNPLRWFRKAKPTGYVGPLQKVDPHERAGQAAAEAFTVRRFAAAETNRLNKYAWQGAHGQSINNDLASDLGTLQARCAYEVANNPYVEGLVRTFAGHVAGRDGPLLQVHSESTAFNDKVEATWKKVFAMPDPAGVLGGVENVKLWVRMILTAGSFLNVISDVRRDGPSSLGWKTIHPRRLRTPNKFAGDGHVAFGKRIDDDGRPIEYYIDKPRLMGGVMVSGVDYDTLPAAIVQHGFLAVEPEQITGYPMLTPALGTAADLRQYDDLVMQAAKNCAAHAVGLEAASPELAVDPDPVGSNYPLESGMVNVAPLGWRFAGLAANQPAANYVEFRHERLAELGRCVQMPLLMVLLSTADANFSAAQFEGSLYHDGIKELQGYLERVILSALVEMMITELVITNQIEKPADYSLSWTWNVPPHANIEKITKALRTLVEDGTIAPSDATAVMGYDWERTVAARVRCAADLEAAGLPPSPVNAGPSGGMPDPNEADEGDDGPPTTAKAKGNSKGAGRAAFANA